MVMAMAIMAEDGGLRAVTLDSTEHLHPLCASGRVDRQEYIEAMLARPCTGKAVGCRWIYLGRRALKSGNDATKSSVYDLLVMTLVCRRVGAAAMQI